MNTSIEGYNLHSTEKLKIFFWAITVYCETYSWKSLEERWGDVLKEMQNLKQGT